LREEVVEELDTVRAEITRERSVMVDHGHDGRLRRGD
jgi:hypothetical protein